MHNQKRFGSFLVSRHHAGRANLEHGWKQGFKWYPNCRQNCSVAHSGWTGKPLGRYGVGIVAFTWFEKPLSTPAESTAVET
jgi:hypothetical protein